MLENLNRSPHLVALQRREVFVPTATAIVHRVDDPHLILVGSSAKHSNPVLPGGKIDESDIVSASLEACARTCVTRELEEETGVRGAILTFLARTEARDRDVREVSCAALAGSLALKSIPHALPEEVVIAHYGVPDFLFVAAVDASVVSATEELSTLSWVDCRDILPDTLSAGHETLVRMYLATL